MQPEQVGIRVRPAAETSQGRLDEVVGHLQYGLEVGELGKPWIVKLASLQLATDVAGVLVFRHAKILHEFLMAGES